MFRWGLGKVGKEHREMALMLSLDRSMEKWAKSIKIVGITLRSLRKTQVEGCPFFSPKVSIRESKRPPVIFSSLQCLTACENA